MSAGRPTAVRPHRSPSPNGRAAARQAVLALVVFASSCALPGGDDPAAKADLSEAATVAEPWLMPSVSSDQFESHPAIDPVTHDFYFVRSSPQFTGWKMFVSRCADGAWGPAEPAEVSGEGVEADPYFTRDGRRLYFISSRSDPPAKTGDDLDIWYVERSGDGPWGAPVRMPEPVNSPGQEWFPRIWADGALTFGSDRAGGNGATDIYRATRRNGRWQVANLGGNVSTAANEYEFEPARDGAFAILMADGRLYRLERRGAGWGARIPIETGGPGFHVGPTLSASGRTLLFARGTRDRSGEIYRLGPSDEPAEVCRS